MNIESIKKMVDEAVPSLENAPELRYLLSIIEIAEKGLESVANSGARETMRRYAEEALQAIRKGD